MVELAKRPRIAPEILPPLQDYGRIFGEQHPYEEVLKSEMNPKWVLLKKIVDPDDLVRINKAHEHRPYATFFLSPEGHEELNRFILNPHFTALSNAYNGVTQPNLEQCESWTEDTKNSIEAWYLDNRFRRALREGKLEVSRETPINGASLPTPHLISTLVGNIVGGITGKV